MLLPKITHYAFLSAIVYTHTHTHTYIYIYMDFLGGSVVKNLPANAGAGSVPGLGRSPREKKMATHSTIIV